MIEGIEVEVDREAVVVRLHECYMVVVRPNAPEISMRQHGPSGVRSV